ncbi:hypothetical protein EUTSA_v10015174mg [Eutrema salsugineum]|uniref:Uncharacterized protein n=1 Tax=Eutrema salsugineum TaxID=72664 RepID=V4LMG1_EUTSA|nr:hypothetical protein EUTSA_v10015174mg [Eutrema salsugineum]
MKGGEDQSTVTNVRITVVRITNVRITNNLRINLEIALHLTLNNRRGSKEKNKTQRKTLNSLTKRDEVHERTTQEKKIS